MPITASKAAFALLAVGAGSVLGYNWITTGCPSGVCATAPTTSAVLLASLNADTGADSCCADAAACDTDATPIIETTAVAETADAMACCDDLPSCCMEKDDCCGDALNDQMTDQTPDQITESATQQTATTAP